MATLKSRIARWPVELLGVIVAVAPTRPSCSSAKQRVEQWRGYAAAAAFHINADAPPATPLIGDAMRYKNLGGTGLLVSEICLGTMTFGGRGGFWTAIGTLDQADADGIVARALDAGVNFIDTADVYSEGLSEEITGRAHREFRPQALRRRARHQGRSARSGTGPNDRGASRGHIMDAVKASLKRLGTDYIDLYQIHGLDPVTPIEETLRALDDLVRQGHVRYVGVSNWSAWTIMKALGIAEQHGWTRLRPRCRPTTPSPAATSSARSCRCWRPRSWA